MSKNIESDNPNVTQISKLFNLTNCPETKYIKFARI